MNSLKLAELPLGSRLSPDGNGLSVGVGAATRDYRKQLMRDLMDREQVDALAFTSSEYFKFATNFTADVLGYERPGICVVPRDGEPFVILHELSMNNWRFGIEADRLWATDAAFYSEHPRVNSRLPLMYQWNDLLASKLEERGLQHSRIGTDGVLLPRVAEILPRIRFESVARQCERMRWVKHEEELVVMAAAASLADWVQERYRENIRPGRLVTELDTSMSAAMAEEAGRRMPGTDLQIYCWTLSGPVSASPHGAGSAFGNLAGAMIETGHVMVNCVYPAIDGLFIENERTWFCGKPSPRQVTLFEAARAANEAACEAAVTGRPVWSVDAAAQNVFERAGFAEMVCHRTGHGLGLGGHDFPIDMSFNNTPMPARLALSIEPGIYEFGLGGFRHDDTVIVGEKPQIMTHTAKDLKSQTVL